MNKKKLLLSTAIASTMLLAGIAMPKTLASTDADVANRTTTFQANDNAYTITVALPKISQEQADQSIYPTLTKNDVEDIINEKFTNPELTIKYEDENQNEFGTGDILTINDKKFTIVLLGDVNSNGKIDVIDASMAFKAYKNNETWSGLKLTSGDYLNNNKVDISDASAIFATAKGKFESFDKVKLADDNVVVVDTDIEEVIENLDTTMYDVALDGDNVNVTIKDENATLKDAFEDALDTFLGSELFDTMLDEAINGYANIDEITVKYGNTTKTYTEIKEKIKTEMEIENVTDLLNKIKDGTTSKETLKSLVKIAVGQEKIDQWKDKNITDLLKKSGITIDVKLKENDNVLLNNFLTEKVYTINFNK